MAENKIWYISSKSQTYGPYSGEEVISLIREGVVQYSDYIFKEGFKGWEYLYNVPDFDRRLLNPGGGQPIVEVPKESVAVEKMGLEETGVKEGEELWYVHDGESQIGPYTSNYIKDALDKKSLFWTYYVWRDGFDNWVQIKDCKEFDRRIKPRGDSPTDLDITTDYQEIKEQAVKLIPQAEGEVYKDTTQPSNFQYGVSDLEQEELKGKYPVKAIVVLILIAGALFGMIRAYPWMIERAKESRAMSMYEKAVGLIEQKNFEEGFILLSDLADMYPATRAARRQQNYIRSKEPSIKSYLADEARIVKRQIEEYSRIYGVLPANSIDINYIPSFWIKNFGDLYFRKDIFGKIHVMARGTKHPVESYVFSSDGMNKESEIDLAPQEFSGRLPNYIKLVYTGVRTNVRPIAPPRATPTPTPTPVQITPPPAPEPTVTPTRPAPRTAPARPRPTTARPRPAPEALEDEYYTEDEQYTGEEVYDDRQELEPEYKEPQETETEEYIQE